MEKIKPKSRNFGYCEGLPNSILHYTNSVTVQLKTPSPTHMSSIQKTEVRQEIWKMLEIRFDQ